MCVWLKKIFSKEIGDDDGVDVDGDDGGYVVIWNAYVLLWVCVRVGLQ